MTRSVPRESSGTNPRYRAALESAHRAKTTSIRDMRSRHATPCTAADSVSRLALTTNYTGFHAHLQTGPGLPGDQLPNTQNKSSLVASPEDDDAETALKDLPRAQYSIATPRRRRSVHERSSAQRSGYAPTRGVLLSDCKARQSQAKQAVPSGGQGARIPQKGGYIRPDRSVMKDGSRSGGPC